MFSLPVHYRDDDYPGVSGRPQLGLICDYSGTGDMQQGCPRGCAGAREHYANDGHLECDDPEGYDPLGPPPAVVQGDAALAGALHEIALWCEGRAQRG